VFTLPKTDLQNSRVPTKLGLVPYFGHKLTYLSLETEALLNGCHYKHETLHLNNNEQNLIKYDSS